MEHAIQDKTISKSVKSISKSIKTILKSAKPSRNPQTPPFSQRNFFPTEFPNRHNAIVKCLRVSYDFLDSLKQRICLLFLAIFPEKAVLKKRLLIYWWIGEGLVLNEEEGQETFGKLLELGFIMPYRLDKRPTSRVNKCKIHPWIRYMLLSIAEKEKLLHLDDKGIPRFDPKKSLRVYLVDDSTNLRCENGSETKDRRTIFNISGRFLSLDSNCLDNSKFVVLQMGRWQVDSPSHHIEVQDQSFLEGLRTQKHLKYLSLRGISRITKLPDSIRELVSLEILDLKACHNLETLPDDISPLKRLTHLDLSECYMLVSMPRGLHNLTSLQVLKGFIIGNPLKTPFRIRVDHLVKLTGLERLSVHIESEAVISENQFDSLKLLENVKSLKISWGAGTDHVVVSFPSSLEKLDLEGFPHENMPEWLQPDKFSRLERLYIKGGNLRKLEGVWSNVKILILKYTNKLKIDKQKVLELFPSLEFVKKVRKEGDKTSESSKESIEFDWRTGDPLE